MDEEIVIVESEELALALMADKGRPRIPGVMWDESDAHMAADAIVSAALRTAGWNKLADDFDKRREDYWYA